jgi:hydroxyacylglutathione hydrolase
MWYSLQKIKNLPRGAQLYCAHEYTQANGRFALTLEPNNVPLQQRVQQVDELRASNKPTVPSTLEQELATNPFLREHSLVIQQSIKMIDQPAIKIFSKIRQLKDNFPPT